MYIHRVIQDLNRDNFIITSYLLRNHFGIICRCEIECAIFSRIALVLIKRGRVIKSEILILCKRRFFDNKMQLQLEMHAREKQERMQTRYQLILWFSSLNLFS